MTIESLNEAARVFLRDRSTQERSMETGVPGLWMYASSEPTTIESAIYTPIVSLTPAGRKGSPLGRQCAGLPPWRKPHRQP